MGECILLRWIYEYVSLSQLHSILIMSFTIQSNTFHKHLALYQYLNAGKTQGDGRG